MQVNIWDKTHVHFQATAREYESLSDQPLDNGGDDAGMTPPE
jgi:hypothetical protein